MNKDTLNFKFSLLSGDLINALAGIKAVCKKYNKKANIYLGLDIEWKMSDVIAAGRQSKITLTESSMAMIKPLLLSQPYINSVESLQVAMPDLYDKWIDTFKGIDSYEKAAEYYKSEQIIDLDKHHLFPIGIPNGNIFRWNFFCYPDMACDLSKPWLNIEPDEFIPENAIVINRTFRARNESIDYKFLKKYSDRLYFVGTYEEHHDFCDRFGLSIFMIETDDHLQLAKVIRSCSFFIGNQSLCFSLAEAMKIPRVLEVCDYLPNVIPCGEHAYDFRFQHPLEYYVKHLAEDKYSLTGYKGDQFSQIE